MEVVPLMKKGACYAVRLGDMGITFASWLSFTHNFWPTLLSFVNINTTIRDLWWFNMKTWNINIVHSIFDLKLPQIGENELVWILEVSRKFSIQIAFHAQNVYYFDQEEDKIL